MGVMCVCVAHLSDFTMRRALVVATGSCAYYSRRSRMAMHGVEVAVQWTAELGEFDMGFNKSIN